MPHEKEEMKRAPYWNFWKVVLVGWLIRYPKQISRVMFTTLGVLLIMIYNAVMN
jgi:hypothetical protein